MERRIKNPPHILIFLLKLDQRVINVTAVLEITVESCN